MLIIAGNLNHRHIPSSIGSASSFLVYNTDINAFKSCEISDTLRGQQKNKLNDVVKPDRDSKNSAGGDSELMADFDIAAAPASLASDGYGDMLDGSGGGLLYVPELADLPEFEMLPDFLDLPNIAIDEAYAPSGNSHQTHIPNHIILSLHIIQNLKVI